MSAEVFLECALLLAGSRALRGFAGAAVPVAVAVLVTLDVVLE